MGLPTIQQFSQQPGGGLATALRGINALSNDWYDNDIKRVQAQYAPLTTQAKVASQMAYANMVGPQALAKLIEHDPILANMSDKDKNAAINRITQAVYGSGNANALMNMPQANNNQNQTHLIPFLVNKFKSMIGGENSPQTVGNPLANDQNNPVQSQGNPIANLPNNQQSNNAMNSRPPLLQPWQQQDNQNNPQQQDNNVTPNDVNNSTFNQNTQTYKANVEQSKEAGKFRAQAVDELGKETQNLVKSGSTIKTLVGLTKDSVFKKARENVQFFPDKQLSILKTFGSKEEQERIGNFVTSISKMTADVVNSFKGKALEKEFGLADNMKVSDKDTWNVMLGKLEALETYRQLALQRNRIASKLISKNHMDRGEAMEQADKMVDGDAIRKNITNMINPKTNDENMIIMEDINGKKWKVPKDKEKDFLTNKFKRIK